jgi:hypothetical protein
VVLGFELRASLALARQVVLPLESWPEQKASFMNKTFKCIVAGAYKAVVQVCLELSVRKRSIPALLRHE